MGWGEEERTIIKNVPSDLKKNTLLLLSQQLHWNHRLLYHMWHNESHPRYQKWEGRIYLVKWRQHYKTSQSLQDKAKKSFYLMLWLVEHSFSLWRVAVLTINSFWGFQMPQLCFSVFNHLRKPFIALYTSPIMNIIL